MRREDGTKHTHWWRRQSRIAPSRGALLGSLITCLNKSTVTDAATFYQTQFQLHRHNYNDIAGVKMNKLVENLQFC